MFFNFKKIFLTDYSAILCFILIEKLSYQIFILLVIVLIRNYELQVEQSTERMRKWGGQEVGDKLPLKNEM